MTALSVQPPFPILTDIDGQPLDDGFIWIGVANTDPIANPITVYWDAALTVTAIQPIRTRGGYPINAGAPARLYVNSDYSIQVQNRTGSIIYSAPVQTERFGNLVSVVPLIDDIASLKAQIWPSGRPAVVQLTYNYVLGDGGGFFRWDAASTATGNGGTIIKETATLTGRWIRQISDGECRVDWFGQLGTADDTSIFNKAAILAATLGLTLYCPPGTYNVTNWSLPANLQFRGAGVDKTTLKRPNSTATNNAIISITQNNANLADFTVDGNKANNTFGANNIDVTGGGGHCFDNINIVNAKSNAGFGTGLALVETDDSANGTQTVVSNCNINSNEGDGLYMVRVFNVRVFGNICSSNAAGGINLANYNVPLEVGSQQKIIISNNRCEQNTFSGISVVGGVIGRAFPPAGTMQATICFVTNNVTISNGYYGIAMQGMFSIVSGNTCSFNGGTSGFGGILFNAFFSICSNNIVSSNSFYGIDAGGCNECSFTDNLIQYNGNATLNNGNGLNVGGSTNCLVTNNKIVANGWLTNGVQIYVQNYEGSGSPTGGFLNAANSIVITSNYLICNSGQLGIWLGQGPSNCTVTNNMVSGTSAFDAIRIESDSTIVSGNKLLGSPNVSVASAAKVILPDGLDRILLTGNTTVTSGFTTYSREVFADKVSKVTVTNPGSGYTSAPTVSFSGGGGSGAAADAAIGWNNGVVTINITNHGTGYTSAPTVTLTGGGGVGATAVATFGCNNIVGRDVDIFLGGTSRINQGGNLTLNGGTSLIPTVSGSSFLALTGNFGTSFYEKSRSVT